MTPDNRNAATAPLDWSIVHDPSLSMFQKVLLTTDGTVTQLIELYTGEPIRVQKLEQHTTQDDAHKILMIPADTALLKRTILLCGAAKSYLYAESFFVFSRLPVAMQTRLEASDVPIGLLWREARLETYREIIEYRRERNSEITKHFDVNADSELLSRTYLIFHNRLPLGVITEKFPTSYFEG